ncbi:sigma-70 family RNA polymerase sigma factor [Psychroserpens mesophilus]|uniref:sigma-70 family RNA polymerase sigma factor n=1 Tax=Psychroserpens mesophilus TaxID=325473 RepID=UPI003D64B2B3
MKINLQDYYPLIYKIINKFDYKLKDELFNECYIQLHNLQERFNEPEGSFETFAYKRLYYSCIDYINQFKEEVTSLDNLIINDDECEVRIIDTLESELDLESDIINSDYLLHHDNNLTEVESFIQSKYYEDEVSVKDIIEVYSDYTLIKSESTIRKILKK